MKIKLNINKKFIISTFLVIIFFNLFFSKLLFNKIFSLDNSDFWATITILKYQGLRSSLFIQNIASLFDDNPETFAYFLINVFLVLSIFLSYEIVNAFSYIKRNITFKYISIIFFSTTLNFTLASRSVMNIRWTLASLVYIIFIIKLYQYIHKFHSHNKFIRRIFLIKEYEAYPVARNKYINLISIILVTMLFLSLHSYSFYYLLSFISLLFIRLAYFFKQRFISIIFLLFFTILSGLIVLEYFSANISDYLSGYKISQLSEYILIFSTFTLHFVYLINFKIRSWIKRYYPWSEFLIMSTSLGFLIPLPFMLTRIYVPYLVVLPIILLTFLDKYLIKEFDLINVKR